MNSKREKRIQRQELQRDKQRLREAHHIIQPTAAKIPPAVDFPENANDGSVIWDFTRFDECDWRATHGQEHISFVEVAKRLRDYSSRTWREILSDKKRDHACDVADLSSEAQKRLRERDLEDVGELLRFRFTGTQRLWGWRDRTYFFVLWWDPDHCVYPVVG